MTDPITSRPDLLPYALPTRIGLPFHGLVRNGQLKLPDNTFKTYTQPALDGSTWKVANAAKANRRALSEEQVASDIENNYAWQNYALIAGRDKVLGGVSVGVPNWPFVDDAGNVWLVGIVLDKTDYLDGRFTIKVVLRSRFGVFGAGPPVTINRVLASAVHVVDLSVFGDLEDYYDAGGPPPYSIIAGTDLSDLSDSIYLDFTEDGRAACWNMASPASFAAVGYNGQLFGWAEITLAGTGSTAAENLGHGIVATVVTRGLDDVIIALETNSDEPSILDHPYPQAEVSTIKGAVPVAPGSTCPLDPEPKYFGSNTWTTTVQKTEPAVSWTWTGQHVEYVVCRYATGDKVTWYSRRSTSYNADVSYSGSTVIVHNWYESCLDAWGSYTGTVGVFYIYDCAKCKFTLKADFISEYTATLVYRLTIGNQVFSAEIVDRTSGWISEERNDGDTGAGSWCGSTWGERTEGGETTCTQTIMPSGLSELNPDHRNAGVLYNQNCNRVWGVQTSTNTLGHWYAATVQGYTDITSEHQDTTFNATEEPVTGELVWSTCDRVCFV